MDTEQKNEQFAEQNEHKDEHVFQSEIQRLSSQLTVKDEQIAELNQQLKQAQKLADQAQQLQLKTQLQLEAEQQKVLALETELQQEEVVSEASANGAENKKVFGVEYLDNWVFYQIRSSHYFIATSQHFADNAHLHVI